MGSWLQVAPPVAIRVRGMLRVLWVTDTIRLRLQLGFRPPVPFAFSSLPFWSLTCGQLSRVKARIKGSGLVSTHTCMHARQGCQRPAFNATRLLYYTCKAGLSGMRFNEGGRDLCRERASRKVK